MSAKRLKFHRPHAMVSNIIFTENAGGLRALAGQVSKGGGMEMIGNRWLRILFAGFVRFGKILFEAAFAVLAVIALWCVGALLRAFDLPVLLAWTAVVLLLASLIGSLFFRWALAATALLEFLTIIAFCSITPEQRFARTVWQKPWRRTLEVRKTDDGSYELRNVRDFLYRSEQDFDFRYRTLTVAPERISTIDVVFSHWDNMEEIAHSMLGLNFADGTTVVISLETRLPEGAKQNGLDGFYRRYELAILGGTPEDLYGLRADHRGETLYVYRLQLSHETMRDLTVSILERAVEMRQKPKFYNSLFRNCTTGLLPMLHGSERYSIGDLRLMLNGLAPKMLFDDEELRHRENESFGSLRARSLVPGLCCGRDAPPRRYAGESECRWLRNR